MAVRTRLTSGCCAVSDTPAVWRVEPQLQRPLELRAVPLPHPAGPDPARRAVLRDLLEEVDVRVEEERQARRELVDREPGGEGRLDVREPVGERERELLRGRRAGFADVVPGDRHRVPSRHLRGAEADRVGNEPHRGTRREDELLLRLVLLEDVVLERAAELLACDAGSLGRGDVHREQHGRRRVDRHRRGDVAEVDARVEVLDVGEGVDRDAALAHLAERDGVVGVATHQGREVERGREAVAARGEELPEPLGSCATAVPKPANMRIVQSFDRYIEAYGPRV